MTTTPLPWSDTAHEVLSGDLNVAVAYITPAGGAVVVSVSPLGLTDRAAGRIGFTTSLGFPRKLERILREALAAPPNRTVQALGNGILAKHGVWRAGRDGTGERLRTLAGRQGRLGRRES
ncbi:hypothetical protein [Streptomyces globisporus]